jgi:hypothetical protein
MDVLTPMLLLVIVLALVGLAAASQGDDTRDSFGDDVLWPIFGRGIR